MNYQIENRVIRKATGDTRIPASKKKWCLTQTNPLSFQRKHFPPGIKQSVVNNFKLWKAPGQNRFTADICKKAINIHFDRLTYHLTYILKPYPRLTPKRDWNTRCILKSDVLLLITGDTISSINTRANRILDHLYE